jgi:dTDP-4-dehydrorhamnose reductase
VAGAPPPRYVLIGASGQLGHDLARTFDLPGVLVPLTHADIEIRDAARARAVLGPLRPTHVINTAAYNRVDQAEDDRATAFALNAGAVGHLATIAQSLGAAFVHVSTDYVFAGDRAAPYLETDAPGPVNVYGASKLAGERAVIETGGRGYVVRTSKLYGRPGASPSAKPSFVAVMAKLARTKPELTIVDEEVGMPTYTRDLAEATVALLGGAYAPGVYHLVNDGPGVTWYGFAEEFFGLLGIATPRKPVPMSAFPRPAKRPLHAALKNTKFPALRPRADALKAFFAECPEVAGETAGQEAAR